MGQRRGKRRSHRLQPYGKVRFGFRDDFRSKVTAPSGRITAYWFDQGAPGAAVIDPATGRGVASADYTTVVKTGARAL